VRLLVSARGKVLTHAFLLKGVWGRLPIRNIFVSISAVAPQDRTSPERPVYILTETGVAIAAASD